MPDDCVGFLDQKRSLAIKFPLVYRANEGLKASEFTDCAQLAHRCQDREFSLLRLSCPVTCGCDNPMSGLFYNGVEAGCPEALCQSSERYKRALDRNCDDMEFATLNALPGWHTWIRMFQERRKGRPSTRGLASDFLTKGCSALVGLSEDYLLELCIKDSHVSSISVFCPTSCRCNADRVDCPSTCL